MSEQAKALLSQVRRLIAQRDAYEEALNQIVAATNGARLPADSSLQQFADGADLATIRKIASKALARWGDL